MRRAFIAVLACIMLVLPSVNVLGGSIWTEDSKAFKNGKKDNVEIVSDYLQAMNGTPSGSWAKVNDGQPGGIVEGAYAYSPEGRMLLFGGSRNVYSPSQETRDATWVFDTINLTWTELKTIEKPSPRSAAQLVFNENTGKYVLFGGYRKLAYLNDTWVFDPSTSTWTNVTKALGPSSRAEHAMTYDRADGSILLYGGLNKTQSLGDLWMFNSSTNTWALETQNYAPGPKSHHSMVYMDSKDLILLAGDGKDYYLYNHNNFTWVRKSVSFPYSYSDIVMVYDRRDDYVIMQWFSTWLYHPITDVWNKIDMDPSPGNLNMYGMVFDERALRAIVHGGTTYDGMGGGDPIEPIPYMQTFVAIIGMWLPMNVMPYNDYGSRAVWDPDRDFAIVYGGMYQEIPWNNVVFADNGVYVYHKDDTYQPLNDTSKTPQKTPKYHAMAYDPGTKSLIVNGGWYDSSAPGGGPCYAITKSFSMVYENWTESMMGPAPTCREYHNMVYHKGMKEMVLFGGVNFLDFPVPYFNDTWALEPISGIWQNMSPPTAPPARAYASMVYVESTREVLMFGGSNGTPLHMWGDLWAYNMSTNTWKAIVSPGPSARRDAGMAYDSKRDVVVLYGGDLGSGSLSNELWEFQVKNGTWKPIDEGPGPTARDFTQLVYDPVRDGILLFGGHDSVMKCDTWLFKFEDYLDHGSYTSQPFDMNGTAYFGNISWKATEPVAYSLVFKVRTGKDLQELTASQFLGPDGTNNTVFGTSETRLSSVHNGSRYVQYMADFLALDYWNAPKLFQVNISYNLMHTIKVTGPTAGAVLKGTSNITWEAKDKDGDSLKFKVVLEDKAGKNWTLAQDITAIRIDNWNTSVYPNGQYKITVIASDDNTKIPLSINNVSGWFNITNPLPNHPPATTLQYPLSDTVFVSGQAQLQWVGSDLDGDVLTYRLYIGKNISNLTSEKPIILKDGYYMLNGNGTYYWTVIPDDGHINGTCLSGIWIVVLGRQNHAPTVGLVSPQNAGVLTANKVTLEWKGLDVDNDPLNYEVHLSTKYYDIVNMTKTSILVKTNKTSYTLNLTEGTYFWNVLVTDGKLNTTGGPDGRSFSIVAPTAGITVRITKPGNHTTVHGTVDIIGTAVPDTGVNIISVKVRIDGGQWVGVTGRSSWNYSLDTKKMKDGPHRIEAQAFGDQFRNSHIVYIDVTVKNVSTHTGVETPLCLWIFLVIAVVTCVVVVVRTYYVNRQRPR
jgi:N-acetylneuraminic acid mutarotase